MSKQQALVDQKELISAFEQLAQAFELEYRKLAVKHYTKILTDSLSDYGALTFTADDPHSEELIAEEQKIISGAVSQIWAIHAKDCDMRQEDRRCLSLLLHKRDSLIRAAEYLNTGQATGNGMPVLEDNDWLNILAETIACAEVIMPKDPSLQKIKAFFTRSNPSFIEFVQRMLPQQQKFNAKNMDEQEFSLAREKAIFSPS